MKKTALILFTLTLAACGGPEWQSTSIENHSATMNFPCKAGAATDEGTHELLGKMIFTTYKCVDNGVTYALQISEMPEADISGESLEQTIPAIKRRATKKGGDILKEERFSLGAIDAYEITVHRTNGSVMSQVSSKIGTTQYVSMAYYPEGDYDKSTADEFHRSLNFQ